jgi:GAF domain-containing protein/CheY-like chemotaxis protein
MAQMNQKVQTFQQRLMRRIQLVLIVGFVLLAIATSYITFDEVASTAQAQARDDIVVSVELFELELRSVVDNLIVVATSDVMSDYAQYIFTSQGVQEIVQNPAQVQLDLLRQFDTLVERGGDRVREVRYISRDGRVWAQVEKINNEVVVEPFGATALVTSPGLRVALSQGNAGQPFISNVTANPDGSGSLLYVYVPVATAGTTGNIVGTVQLVIQFDVFATYLTELADGEVIGDSDRRVVLVDANNRIIGQAGEQNLSNAELLAFLNDNSGELTANNVSQNIVSARQIDLYEGDGFPWRLVTIDSQGVVFTTTLAIILVVMSVVLAMLLMSLLSIRYLIKPLTDQISAISAKTSRLAGEHTLQMGDEVQVLQSAVVNIESRLQNLTADLEQQVMQRSRDLKLASRIGREVATLYDIDILLNRAINLIADELGFYHAQVFLLDDAQVNAVLVHSRGKAGQRLLEQNFKIPVGSDTVIGSVTSVGEPVIVNDTAQRGVKHGFNPLLPDTRAELGLPLIMKGRIIGALDIQSKQPNVFRNDDLPIYNLLADQIAIAIENARLIGQTDKRIQQIDNLNRQLTRVAWEETDQRERLTRNYRYDLMDVESIEEHDDTSHAPVLRSDITIRGEVIGQLQANPGEEDEFTEGDAVIMEAVANRVALAIENARLFRETQSTLTETSTLYQLSRYLNEANTLADILQSIIVSVMPEANSGQIWMFEDYDRGDEPEWLVMQADLITGERDSNNKDLRGLRLNIKDHVFMRSLSREAITLINNTRVDNRLDSGLKLIFRRLNAEALVFIPLVVRSQWRGVISVGFEEARDFNERETRIYGALSDQAGVAIDNRLLLQQTEMEVARNENLYAASRIINTAETMSELVYAAVATANDPRLNFSLSVLEGELDNTGWPTRARVMARSNGGMVDDVNEPYIPPIDADSPMRNREPQLVYDELPSNQNVPDAQLWVREQGYRFMAIFPLFSVNQPIALFHVASDELRDLTPSDYEVYRALTGQMSSQIQIRRLLERTEMALDETRRLYVASRAITTAQDLDTIYQSAIEHLARPFLQNQMDGDSAQIITISLLIAAPEPSVDAPYLDTVYRWDSVSGVKQAPGDGAHIPQEKLPLGQMTADRDGALVYNDIIRMPEDIAQAPVLREYLIDVSAVSAAIVPVRRSVERWFGVVLCYGVQAYAFNEQYTRFMMALADQIAIAIDNVRLVDEARFEAQRAQMEAQRALALAETAQISSRIGDEDITKSFEEAFQRVAMVSSFDRWMLIRIDEETQDLYVSLAQTPDGDVQAGHLYTSENTPLSDAFNLARTLMINNVSHYPTNGATDEGYADLWGKHIVSPVQVGDITLGAVLMGRSVDDADMDERDQQLIETLAAQVGIALENRRLFDQTQREQRNLRSILETLPAGMLVLDPHTLRPLQFNEQASALLGQPIDVEQPFSIEAYNLYRTGTQLLYPRDDMPIYMALETGEEASTDDVAVMLGDEIQVDLLVNAAPISDANGEISAIVVAFQDITSLRSLENTLQENLRETVSLYEAQRQLAEANNLENVLDVVITHLILQQPMDAFIILSDMAGRLSIARSFTMPPEDPDVIREMLDLEDSRIYTDLQSANINDAARDVLLSAGAQSVLTVPINVSTRDLPIGWIVVTHDEPYGISNDQERVFTQLRDVAATAIDNRLLIESQESTLREVRTLYSATNALSRARDADQLAQVLQDAADTLEADYAFVYLDESAGMQAGEVVLLDRKPDDVSEQLDFRAILSGYEIPPGGVYINDLSRIRERVDTEQALIDAGINAFAAIHLRPKDIASGMIIIAYRDSHRFTDTEDRYLNTLADGASVVFNTFILFDQIQGSLEETSTLYQASRALADASEVDDILEVIVEYLIAPHINHVFIALLESRNWDVPGAMVQVVASWSQGEIVNLQGISLSQDQFPAWSLLAEDNVRTIDDINTEEDLTDIARIGVQSLDAQSLIVVPLRVPKRIIGAIWLGSREAHTHSDRELRTYQAFAEQASLSMEANYLLQQTERRARQLQTSAEVSQSAAQILDLEELMPQLVDLIKKSFGYDHAQIFLMDENDEYAVLRASTGEAGRELLAINHMLRKGSDSVIGMVTQRAEPQIALDTADANVVHQPNPHLPLTRSEMALPLIIKGEVVGALDVQSNLPNAFNEEDISGLTTLAAQISVAIDNANLYEDAQEQASKMSFLFEITSAAAAADKLEDALQVVATRVQDMLGTLAVIIYLPSEYIDDRSSNADATYTMLEVRAISGVQQPTSEIESVNLEDEDSVLVQVARNKKSFIVEDIAEDPSYLPVSAGAHSSVLMPLNSGNELVGLIVIEDERRAAFGYDTIQLLLTLSGSLSALIQSKLLLEQLQKTNEQLRELDRLKSDFLANMSHELRTPLNSIIGFSRVMLKGIDGPLTEMQEQDLTTIYNSGQHLLGLINDILDQAKMAADKLDLKFSYFEIKPLLEGVKSIGIGLVKDKDIDMRLDISPNMAKIYGDEFRTRQVLLNLVSNASKFTSTGTITIRAFMIETQDGKQMVQVEVEDTGIGIAEKDIPLLFEAFRQVDSSLTRTAGGTGLGLPIAKSLTEMQGGEMFVKSEVNAGSVFSITIPTQPGAEPQEEDDDAPAKVSENGNTSLDEDTVIPSTGMLTPPEEGDEQEKRPDTQPARITTTSEVSTVPPGAKRTVQNKREVLLIEDDKTMVDQFRRALQREGFEVQTADHPAYAEAMASNLRPNVVVMDVNFGGEQGWNILERLKDRDDTFDIPVIVVTLSNESERAYKLGAHTFIQRPFDPADLQKAVLQAEKESNMDRILIIDDQASDVRLLTQLLNENGTYRVFSADNGIEGISLVARRRPNLIILDLRMPEMDGFAVLQELRDNPETANIPVLVVTGEIDLKSDEQQKLSNVRVLHKTDISEEEFQAFIDDVRNQLDAQEE